jgi:hypothetical protein
MTYSQDTRNAAFELLRLWRMGWDRPGSSGYQSFLMAHRVMRDRFPKHSGSMIELARRILASQKSTEGQDDHGEQS